MIKLTKGTYRHGSDRLRIALYIAVPIFVIALFLPLNQSSLGQLLQPAMSAEAAQGWWGRLWTSVIIFLPALSIIYALLGQKRTFQAYFTWVVLAGLALLCFYSFSLSYEFIGEKLPFLLSKGAVTTLYISAISISLAFVFALAGAMAKLSGIGVLEGVGAFYTSYFRGVPLLVQLFLIYMGLPQIGIIVEPVPAGIAALSLVYGAYMTEIFRSGIESIPAGQWQASDALGMRRVTTFRKVILPQAMRVIVPPTGNQFIAMLKDSSLVSVVGVWDIMFIARTQGRADFKMLELLITASIVYWIMTIVLELIQKRIEQHYSKSLEP